MYYLIKKLQDNPQVCFIGFAVPKYIAVKNSENIILEFSKDGKTQRKWIKREDIILLTDDKKFFLQTMDKFKKVQETQQKLVDEARSKLDESLGTFTETVNAELDDFQELKSADDIPCMLKDS